MRPARRPPSRGWKRNASRVPQALRLRRKRPKGGQRSYRHVGDELFQAGYANSNGAPFRRYEKEMPPNGSAATRAILIYLD
jgi:hypothetical protein